MKKLIIPMLLFSVSAISFAEEKGGMFNTVSKNTR
jgi:hypothetical protein